MYTKLKNRTLWFDGDSSYPPTSTDTTMSLFVDELTKDIEQYNRLVAPEKRLRVKTENSQLSFEWRIPEFFRQMNVKDFLIQKLEEQNITDAEVGQRAVRVARELKLYEQHGLLDVLRVLIYVINTLNSNSVVWGVGRGSSVSSYILYLIGVHDVDSVKYDLDIKDFLH